MTANDDIREIVRQRYAESARQLTTTAVGGSCCGSDGSCCGPSTLEGNVTAEGTVVFGSGLYSQAEAEGATAAVEASLGCGVPTAVADLHEGETVLDLGSGAGGDVLISARRVGPIGPRDRSGHDR